MRREEIVRPIIFGRREPHLYAFTTGTVPEYLKVGDTYRPVPVRLGEWKRLFPDLKMEFEEKAVMRDPEVFFRDYAVHRYLEQDLGKERLTRKRLAELACDNNASGIPYSNEFFRDADVSDIEAALLDIKNSYDTRSGKYRFFRFEESRIPIAVHYERHQDFEPRPNQQETIQAFKKAAAGGRTNLLMYAVMRFGKSFTSMCCAVEMGAKLVVVVSAKADVREEWKKTVESHVRFGAYTFVDADDLLGSPNALEQSLSLGRVVVFLTLQDLSGEEIKEKHREVFGREIDLLLIDETHYGARAEEYGRVLRAHGMKDFRLKKLADEADTADVYDTVKILRAKVRIHLSGTPYRILMGSEFEKEDLIAFYQFSDIAKDKEAWDSAHLGDESVEEWDNPYYGFPQMIRFAFRPNASSRALLDDFRSKGLSSSLSELLRPISISQTPKNAFVYEREVLDLLRSLDGANDDPNILCLLDSETIREGKLCRHIVMVLPFRASCDAMKHLIGEHANAFHQLGGYRILNIAGFEDAKAYPDTRSITEEIRKCEAEGQKTLTLTVNRMLTGSTVPEWDTMIFLRESSSPQEYDQAVFRLQNQYLRTFTADGTDHRVVFNMKPQTLLVDFDPDRMFRLQEERSKIYNVNTDEKGNLELEKRLEEELRISPIITVKADNLTKVTPRDILDAIRRYSSDRSVLDEARDIPADAALLNDEEIVSAIGQLPEIDSRKGIYADPYEGEEKELELGETPSPTIIKKAKCHPPGRKMPRMKSKEREMICRESCRPISQKYFSMHIS